MLCDQKLRHVVEYNTVAADLAEALAVLYAHTPTISGDYYELLKHFVDERRIEAHQIRLNLDGHVSKHGC